MWLLRSKTATLEYFVSPEHVPRYTRFLHQYAILSHVWGENDQTFQEIQKLPSKCSPGQTPRDIASEKIRKACELAEKWGYKWIWIDTCCIDKSSSAELSEAINSMFRYYSLADVCFAYLEDVLSDDRSMPEDEFKKSKWHTRGWTLQELIAPKLVAFVSSSWSPIAFKDDQARLVEEATGVPVEVLADPKQMKRFSIAQRMSWAARRVTTREEDEAYCLLGIFDINMPTLYGEGRKAFRRLQEEIMRQSPDTTLFAWGLHCTWDELVNLRAEDPAEHPDYHLFATSPSSFHQCSQLHFVDPTKCLNQSPSDAVCDVHLHCSVDDAHDVLLPLQDKHDGYITFASTPHGVSTVIPTLEYQKQLLGHLGWVVNRRFLLLLLQPLPSENILSNDKLYRVGGIPLQSMAYRVGDVSLRRRVVSTLVFPYLVYAPTEVNDKMLQKSASTTWRRVYLADEHIVTTMKTMDTSMFNSMLPVQDLVHRLPSPIHIDLRHLTDFNTMNSEWNLPRKPADVSWIGDPPLILELQLGYTSTLLLSLGVCTRSGLRVGTPQQVAHWAYMVHPDFSSVKESSEARHDCSTDYISNWPHRSRQYAYQNPDGRRFQATLSFTPFELDPERTLVLHAHKEHVEAFADDCEILQDDWYDGTDYDSSPSSDAVAQPSAAVNEPVASSAEEPHTESSAHGPRQAKGIQTGETHKREHTEMEGNYEDSEVEEEDPHRKRFKATVKRPPERTTVQHSSHVGNETDEIEASVVPGSSTHAFEKQQDAYAEK
ncbi:heterokaryon incompatibility protein-domain-containing protein [Fomes fomentarius]|nr:heterokaryon incompatibility protein-domain-containing protein [Fomes fomentarius]